MTLDPHFLAAGIGGGDQLVGLIVFVGGDVVLVAHKVGLFDNVVLIIVEPMGDSGLILDLSEL